MVSKELTVNAVANELSTYTTGCFNNHFFVGVYRFTARKGLTMDE